MSRIGFVFCTALLMGAFLRAPAVPIDAEIKEAAPEAFGGLVDPPSAEREALRVEFASAYRSFQAGDYDGALARLRAAAARDPDLPPAPLMLARLFIRHHHLEQGRALLEQAAAEIADFPGLHVTLGEVALSEGRLADASVQFETARSLSGRERWKRIRASVLRRVHEGLATVAARRGRWTAAREHLSARLELGPDDPRVRQQLAQAIFKLGDRDLAHAELERAAAADSELDSPALSMARLHAEHGEDAAGLEWAQRAIEGRPRDAPAHRMLARLLLRQGDAEGARSHAEIAARLEPDTVETRVLVGLVARHRRDFAAAERIFESLQREVPEDASASNQLALVLIEQGDPSKHQRALEIAERNARSFPRHHETLSTLGWVYYRLGRLDDAERALAGAVRSGVAAPDTAYYLARVLADRDQPHRAQAVLETALKARGNFVHQREARALLATLEDRPK